MTHESKPTAERPAQAPHVVTSGGVSHLEMRLPKPSHPDRDETESDAMFDRVEKWDEDFKQSVQKALREVYGYKTAVVKDFQCLIGKPGHDENDYEVSVSIGDEKNGKIGGAEAWTVKIIVRRVPEEVLY
jgi:hypothetical protein